MVREKQFYKTLFTIAIPAALQSIISFSVGMADTVMVGQLGDNALAGVAVSNQVNTFLFSLLAGITSGSSVLIAQYWGKRDAASIKYIFSLVFLACVSIGFLATAAALVFPRSVLRLMAGDNEALIAAAIPYFTTVCFSYALYAATSAMTGMMRNVEVVMAAMFTSLGAALLNIFLNWILIFGKFGFPAMGVKGAALATLISRIAETAIIAVYILFVQKKFPLKLADLFHTKIYIIHDYLRYGLPIAAGDSQWAFVGVIKAAIIGHLGTLMVSANAIADTIMGIGYISSGSLAAGAIVVVGKAVGSGDNKKARQYSDTIQIIFAVMAVVMASLVFGLRAPIAGLFDVSESVRGLAIQLITIGAFTLLGTLYHAACFVGINRGAGDGRFVFFVDMICGWLIVIPCMFVSAHVLRLSMPLVFLMSRIDQCFKWIIAFIRLRGNKWIHNVTRNRDARDIGVPADIVG